jgi:hypothetical protein
MSLEGADDADDEVFIREIDPNPTAGWNCAANRGTDAKYWSFVAVKN